MNSSFSNAYSEVLEVLKYIPKKDFKKIPLEIIYTLKNNRNIDNDFVYNQAVPFNKQDLSEEAKKILASFYKDYWTTSEEKERIKQKEKFDFLKDELLKSQKYGNSVLWKKNKKT